MFEVELSSSLSEYDGEFFEIVYSDEHPDFIYILGALLWVISK